MIYLDEASTAFPKAPGVGQAMADAVANHVNPGRGIYPEALSAARLLYRLREAAAATFGVSDSSRIVLTPGATWSLNAVLRGCLRDGGRVICSAMEHNAVSRTLADLGSSGVEWVRIAGDADGRVSPDDFLAAGEAGASLWVLNHGGNVNGLLQDLPAFADAAAKGGVPLLVDLAQSAGQVEVDLGHPGIRYAVIPGHKGLRGPMGCGLLYIAQGESLPPFTTGGTGGESELQQMPAALPDRFEAGTVNLPGAAGLLCALVASDAASRAVRFSAAMAATRKLHEALAVQGWQTYWAGDLPLFSVTGGDKMEPAWLSQSLGGNDPPVAARAGLHCAPWAHERLGTLRSGTLRLSPAAEITEEELGAVLAVFELLAVRA